LARRGSLKTTYFVKKRRGAGRGLEGKGVNYKDPMRKDEGGRMKDEGGREKKGRQRDARRVSRGAAETRRKSDDGFRKSGTRDRRRV
jgi:hypothetical protein